MPRSLAVVIGVLLLVAFGCTFAAHFFPMQRGTQAVGDYRVGVWRSCVSPTGGQAQCADSVRDAPCSMVTHKLRTVRAFLVLVCVFCLAAAATAFAKSASARPPKSVLVAIGCATVVCEVIAWSIGLTLWAAAQCGLPSQKATGNLLGPSLPLQIVASATALFATLLSLAMSDDEGQDSVPVDTRDSSAPPPPAAATLPPAAPAPPHRPVQPSVDSPVKPIDPPLAVVPPHSGDDWDMDPRSGVYFSPSRRVYWDPRTNMAFDPTTRQWSRGEPYS